ncbi:MAG TPA: SDR family oxidoreductase, partial [Kofleriaceae bacterium]
RAHPGHPHPEEETMNLSGRVVIITGGGSGIGRAAARRFARRRAVLHLVDLDAAAVEAAALECASLGARAHFHVADCRDAGAMERVAAAVLERDALVDVVFLNAGVGYGGPMARMTLDEWRLVLDTNLYGVVHGLHAFLPAMLGKPSRGHVLITASMLGLFALPGAGAYAASKHALVGLAESLRAELGPAGLEVTALCPGLIASNIIKNARVGGVGLDRALVERWWARRGAAPDAVARIAVECVEKRRGGVRVAKPTGSVLWLLRRYAPPLYERALAGAAAAMARLDQRRSAGASRPRAAG